MSIDLDQPEVYVSMQDLIDSQSNTDDTKEVEVSISLSSNQVGSTLLSNESTQIENLTFKYQPVLNEKEY